MRDDVRDIDVTINFKRIWENRDSSKMLFVGSTRSSKSYAIMQYLIVRMMMEDGLSVFACRHDGTTCESTLIKDFKELMILYFRAWDFGRWRVKDKTFVFQNGSNIVFGGTQDVMKLHGRKQDICFLNEANSISYEAYTQLAFRTTKQMIFDMNPSDADSWVLTKVKSLSSCLYFHSTYADNPFLSKEQIESIEQLDPSRPENITNGTADKYRWEVYGLGLPSAKEGVIIPAYKWKCVDPKDFPQDHQCEQIVYGIDFGYSVDPTAIVKVQLCNTQVWVSELLYEKGLDVVNVNGNNDSALIGRLEILGIKKTDLIIADGASPERVRALQKAGFKAKEGIRYNGSVVDGLGVVLCYNYNINERSTNLRNELRNYTWIMNNATGLYTSKPIDKNNHLIDALRMVMQTAINPRVRGGIGNSSTSFFGESKSNSPMVMKIKRRKW